MTAAASSTSPACSSRRDNNPPRPPVPVSSRRSARYWPSRISRRHGRSLRDAS
jgi:hypothetical protein